MSPHDKALAIAIEAWADQSRYGLRTINAGIKAASQAYISALLDDERVVEAVVKTMFTDAGKFRIEDVKAGFQTLKDIAK